MRVATTSRGGWFVGALAFHGNPYDEHILSGTIDQVIRLSKTPEHVYIDQGHLDYNYVGESFVHVYKRRRGRTPRSGWR